MGRQVPAPTQACDYFFCPSRERRCIGKATLRAPSSCPLDMASDELFSDLLVIPKGPSRQLVSTSSGRRQGRLSAALSPHDCGHLVNRSRGPTAWATSPVMGPTQNPLDYLPGRAC